MHLIAQQVKGFGAELRMQENESVRRDAKINSQPGFCFSDIYHFQ